VPVQVSNFSDGGSIVAGEQHSLARKNDGTAWAWGNNGNGELGNGTNTNSNLPIQVTSMCPVLLVDDDAEQWSDCIFPNPGDGRFTLRLSTDKAKIDIYNMLGQLVYHAEISTENSMIDLSGELKGMYLARISSGRKILTEKFLIR
jgi:hypothetical protein